MADQDVRDVRSILDEREDLKKQLEESRAAHRAADADARKVPHLEQEIARLKRRVEHIVERFNSSAAREGELEQGLREAKAQLRDQGELERGVVKAMQKANEYRVRAEEAESQLHDVAEELSATDEEIEGMREEIERLKKIEAAALEDVRTRDALREHVGA